jgi:cysteine synthase
MDRPTKLNGARTTRGRGRLFESVIDTVGDTPCIKVNSLAPDHVRLYVKAEFFNPAGSVKDRLALNIIESAERAGFLKPGQTVVEATSGNTGIGLAMVCSAKGYPLVVTMADSFSVERRAWKFRDSKRIRSVTANATGSTPTSAVPSATVRNAVV